MKKRIKDIADIQIGYQFRKKIEPEHDGTHRVAGSQPKGLPPNCLTKTLLKKHNFTDLQYRVIQIRDFDDHDNLNKENLVQVKISQWPQKYLVNRNDVLFLARGHRNYAIPIKESLERTIVASYFFILKIKTKNLLPEYLAWFINQSPAQEYMHNLARRGTHMPVVPKAAFENLPVNIPDIKTQEKIVQLNNLFEKERNLLNSIQQKRSLLIRSLCLKAAKQNL